MVKKNKMYTVRKSYDFYYFMLDDKMLRTTPDGSTVVPLPLDFVQDFKYMCDNQILEWEVRIFRSCLVDKTRTTLESKFKSFLDVAAGGYRCFNIPHDQESIIYSANSDGPWTVQFSPTDKRLVDSSLVVMDYTPFVYEKQKRSL